MAYASVENGLGVTGSGILAKYDRRLYVVCG
jgi:hypothetical protein